MNVGHGTDTLALEGDEIFSFQRISAKKNGL